MDRHPHEQVTKKALITVARAGLKGPLRGRLGPLLKQHIATLVEERFVFVDRLVDYWLDELDGKRVVSMTPFCAHSGVRFKRLTAAQRSRVVEWLSAHAQ